MSNSSDDAYEARKLSSFFWAQFCQFADLPVERECFDQLDQLGVLANINKNLGEMKKYAEVFDESMDCCRRAGEEAKKQATAKGDQTITPEVFVAAFQHVAGVVRRARQAAGHAEPEGPLC